MAENDTWGSGGDDYNGERWSKGLARPPAWLQSQSGDVQNYYKNIYDTQDDPNGYIANQTSDYRNKAKGMGLQVDEGDENVLPYVATGDFSPWKQAQATGNTGITGGFGNTGINGGGPVSGGAAGDTKNKWNDLYEQMKLRAQQGLNIDDNDPIIKGQVDTYRAEQTRAGRDFISDAAESAGGLGNMEGTRAIAAEKAGQNTASFASELKNRELTSRRQEIQNYMQQMGGMLSQQQQLEMQHELAMINQHLSQQQIDLSAEDRAAYWDAVNSGRIGG
jgi:hypothetical protein